MQAEIIIVGTHESLEADKKTAQQVARTLVANSIQVREQIGVCFDRARLQQAISTALSRSSILVTIGGMGGAAGFLCKQVMSEGLRLPLVHNPDALRGIQNFSKRTGTPYYQEDVTFASLPQNGRALLPRYGKQPGCIISAGKQHVILLPEQGNEAAAMLGEQVLPVLSRANATARSVHSLRTYGITEPQVRRMLVDLMGTTNPTISIHPSGEELEIRVTGQAADHESAAALTNPLLRTIAERLGDYAYGLNVDSLQAAVVQKMRRKELDISVAESGTSGMLGKILGDTEGGQSLVRYHIMAETNESKTRHLGIPAKNLRRRGDVSEYTAVAMAHGALVKGRSALGVGICADIPGVAQKEEAQVYIAVCNDTDVYVKKLVISEQGAVSNDSVIDATVARGLNMTRLFVDYLPERYHGSIPLDVALASKENVTDGESYEGPDAFVFRADDLDTPKVPKTRKEKKKQKIKANAKGKNAKPTKKKKPVRTFALLLAVLMLVGSAGYLGLYKYRSVKALELRDDLAGLYTSTRFMGLKQINEDVVAYMSIEGTEIKYPIVQAQDNAYYLRRDFNKEDNQHGIPFMDASVDVYKPSENMVIYGHNMMDGQIFGELLNYQKLEYYKEHPIINFDTISHLDTAREGSYKIMSIFITNTYEKHGPIFNYHKNINMNAAEQDTYIKQLELRSLINTTVDTQVGDELITLSTCDYNFTGSRFVVVARRVRAGETAEVDTASAHLNNEPLLPEVWYKSFGGNRPSEEKINAAGGADGTMITKESQRLFLAEKSIDPVAVEEIVPVTVTQLDPEDSVIKEEGETPEQEESSTTPESSVTSSEDSSSEAEAKAAAEKKAIDEAKAAEAAKVAEDIEKAKKAEENAKIAAEEAETTEISAQETKAKTAEATAKEQADIALAAHQETMNSEKAEGAKAHAATASEASKKATTAAAEATAAADLAGTETAKTAATNASTHAANAKQAADLASANLAEMLEEEKKLVEENTQKEPPVTGGNHDFGTLKVNGIEGDALDIVARIVQNEVGTSFHPEAIKAQAIAAYTYVAYANARGNSASVYLSSKPDSKIVALVSEVLGEAVYYNGGLAFTPYHATSAGSTTTSASVWGGSHPYLVAVDSSVDQGARGYQVTTKMSSSKVAETLFGKLGITADGDPSSWFEVLTNEPGGYVGKMKICGETKSLNSGNTLTGRLVRESVFHLRSSFFTIEYDSGSDEFVMTTYGYGHGVGMSQTGANFYAQDGWSYRQILEHYYPGTTVQ